MAVKKGCPKCGYRNPMRAKKCRQCRKVLKTPVWYVDVHTHDGKRTVRRAASLEEARQLEESIKTGRVKQNGEARTMEEWWLDYLDYRRRLGRRDIASAISRWDLHLRPVFGRLRPWEVTREKAEQYRKNRLGEGAAFSTINREISLLSHFLATLAAWGVIEDNPLKGIGVLREKNKRLVFLTREEFERLCGVINPRYRDFLIFLTYTGLRLREALNVRWRDVMWENKSMVVRETKGSRPHGIPLHDRVMAVLSRRAKEWNGEGPPGDERIFRHSDSEFRRAFKKALAEAGLDTNIRVHDLRHTFASWLALAGVPLQQIQMLLGHKDFQTTLRYAHLNPSILRGAIEKI